MQLHFFSLNVFILILLAQPAFSQCTITSCANPAILTGEANWVDGIEGVSNGMLTISGITLGNIDCFDGDAGAGIDIYIYQLLPDGNRVSLCNLNNEAPDNFVFKYSIGIGPASDCTDAAFPIPDVQLFDHQSGITESLVMFLCDGGVYEVVMALYVDDENQSIPDEQSVYSALDANQYVEINLGTFFVNYTNEFATPNPYPLPITTAVITGPNGETGTMTANCGEEVSLFFEGLSYIGRCRFDEESVPNFYPFCDPSDPTMMNETYSPSITSETENFVSYTINGGDPVIIRNGNGGDPTTDAYGGQQTGPGNLPGLGADQCYTGICGARAIPFPYDFCDGDVIEVTLQTLDVYSGITVEDKMTITYSGGECNICEPLCPNEANIEANATERCSGESLIINGTTVGEGEVFFALSESSGVVDGIMEGVEFTLPENNTCTPITYTFNATALCEDGYEIANGTLSIEVTVYPLDISAFVSVNDGACSTGVSVDAGCENNISVNPSESQTANAGEYGMHNYTANWAGGGPNCVIELNLTANYNCPPDVVCPSSADITISSNQICSGESVTINGTTSGEGSGSFTITESTGTITEINEGTALILPENNSCAIITYTFTATAVCDDDGSNIPGGNLTASVMVYPTDISAFVSVNDGACSTGVSIDAGCENNISVNPSESQTANGGEYGMHNYTANWAGGGPNCISELNLTGNYNCPPDVVCPSSADITISNNQICSGESVTINGTTSGEGSASFTITESTGTITEINVGTALILPENNTCEIITYTFTATAVCGDDGSNIPGGNLTASVMVYPTDISAFVTANDGACSTNITIDDNCTSNISISPSKSQTANSGESGIHNYTASWAGGGPNCVTNLPLMPAYNCISCPTEASISASVNEVCSGESVIITGTTVGEGTASFEITDESGSVTEITKGVVFNMPANTTCAPVVYTFTAVALCDDDNSEIPGSPLSVDIIVYPTQIANFVSITKGDCTTSVTIDPSCASNVGVSPSESQSANPGESGTHEYIFSWIGDGPNCVPDETLIGNYDCPPDIVCPESASITTNVTELCTPGSIIIGGEVTGDGEAAFTITESTGIFLNITEDGYLDLPANLTCNPITYTFNATAVCVADGSEIRSGTQSVDVTVYPFDISAFISTNDGECSTSVSIDASCGTNVSISPSESQTANSGESGTHNYTASWTGGGPMCIANEMITANYNCPPDIMCPTEATIESDVTEVCSGESATITGSTIGEGKTNFMITESTGTVTEILDGVAFDLPENTTCVPVTYSFTATATCTDDGSEINNGTLSIDITVYPTNISAFITSNDGECSTSISVDESCGNNLNITPALSQTASPAESGTHSYMVSWVGGGPSCIADEMLTANYNCPTEVVCPTAANITVNSNEICSGESVVISGEFEGEGAASYSIIETSGLVTDIESGVALILPENNTCMPTTYSFELTAANCVADGSTIPLSQTTVEVTIYPSDINSYISTIENNCITTVNIAAVCEDLLTVFPDNEQFAEPGSEAGTHNYTVSWNGGGSCITDTELSLNYMCGCIFDPSLAELELVGGSTNVCFGSSIEYKAKYDGIDRDLALEGGVDEPYNAAFIIFIEPIDFNQPTESDAIYRITNDTILENDETIEPGTYYIYYFQGIDINDPTNDESMCLLYSQDFIVVEILPEITSGEAICTGHDNLNEVTISVADGSGIELPNNAYVESNGVQYAYETIEVVDTTKVLTFINLPDGYYFFYYEDALGCSSTDLLTEFNCESQMGECPIDVSIEPIETAQCSGATISLNVNVTGSTEFSTINWFDEDGNVVENPSSVNLPLNEGCDPIEITYRLEVTCSLVFSDEVTITVYPNDISAFLTPFSDGCTASVTISEACSAENIIANTITVSPGSSGTTDILVSYSDNPCFEYFAVTVPYDCTEIAGCTDPCAPNYDPNATEDGTCLPYDNTCNEDCTLGDITVFDPNACLCVVSIVTVNGCTDNNACNYNPEANCDDGNCTYTTCNEDGCEGDIETIDPNDACACVIVEAQNIGCDDPAAINYDATVNCSNLSECVYETVEISIAELCYCDNEMNIDLDGDGSIDLVAEEIRITGPAGDTWSLTANNNPAVVDSQNMAISVDGSVVASEITPGIYTLTIYHSADGSGFGGLVFTSTESNETVQIANSDGCDCSVDCAPPVPASFECDE